MNLFKKVVVLSCLTYGLYGIISWIQVGAFVPAFLLRPIVFILFLIFFMVELLQKGNSSSNKVGMVWLFSFVFVGQYFMELFFPFQQVQYYMNWIHPFILVISVLLFFVWIVLLIHQITLTIPFRLIILITGIATIFMTIFFYGKGAFDWGIILSAILFFGIDRLMLGKELQRINAQQLTLLYGVGSLTFMDQITYLFS